MNRPVEASTQSKADANLVKQACQLIMTAMRRIRCHYQAFTLVELLVVIGIISVLIALLLSAVQTARQQANMIACAANMGNVAKALLAYAHDQGVFPPNTIDGPNWWTEEPILSPYASYSFNSSLGASHNGLVCNEDEGSVRSYAMNIWASSLVDISIAELSPVYGTFWKPSHGPSAQLLLVVESYSSSSLGPNWNYAPPAVGQRGQLAGQRFGALGGVTPFRIWSRRFVNAQIEWRHNRHRIPRVNLAFADGHVKSFTQAELVNADGSLTGEAYWTPTDQ